MTHFRSARKGALLATVWKSSIVSSTSAALAIARRCSTCCPLAPCATGERNDGTYGVGGAPDDIDNSDSIEEGLASDDIPDSVGVNRYETWRNQSQTNFGLRSSSIKCFKYLGALKLSWAFSAEMSAHVSPPEIPNLQTGIDGGDPRRIWEGQPQNFESSSHRVGPVGRKLKMRHRASSNKPTHVNIPPQAPDPGHAWRTTSKRSSSEIFPVAYAPASGRSRVSYETGVR